MNLAFYHAHNALGWGRGIGQGNRQYIPELLRPEHGDLAETALPQSLLNLCIAVEVEIDTGAGCHRQHGRGCIHDRFPALCRFWNQVGDVPGFWESLPQVGDPLPDLADVLQSEVVHQPLRNNECGA